MSGGPYSSTWHRDGTVSIWDVYQQVWRRLTYAAAWADHQLMASINDAERLRIKRLASASVGS